MPDAAAQRLGATTDLPTLVDKLAHLVGEDRVFSSPDIAIQAVRPAVKVRPADEDQLGGVLKLADAEGLGVCVAGGGTKLGRGNPPRRFDLLIEIGDLRGRYDVDVDNLSLTVAAGLTVAEAMAGARARGRLLPLDPSRPSRATVGGVVATSDQGARGAGYGGVRDVVLGLKAVLTDGSRVTFGGRTMKNVSGYDMTKLFVGSFGVLGVITEVTLRLLPQPEKQAVVMLPAGSLAECSRIVHEILDSFLQPLALEVVSAELGGARAVAPVAGSVAEAAKVAGAGEIGVAGVPRGDYLLLVGFAGHTAAVARSTKELGDMSQAHPSAVLLEDAAAESLFEALADALPAASPPTSFVSARATVPISSAWRLAAAAEDRARVEEIPLRFRLGAARGTLDLYVERKSTTPSGRERLTALLEDLRVEADTLGGQLVITDGIGLLEPGFDAWGHVGTGLPLMRRLKDQFDPHNILSPGRFVGGI